MRDRYDFFYDYFDTEEKRYKKGEMKVNIGQYLRNAKSSNFKIPSNYQYRPDKIAYTFSETLLSHGFLSMPTTSMVVCLTL